MTVTWVTVHDVRQRCPIIGALLHEGGGNRVACWRVPVEGRRDYTSRPHGRVGLDCNRTGDQISGSEGRSGRRGAGHQHSEGLRLSDDLLSRPANLDLRHHERNSRGRGPLFLHRIRFRPRTSINGIRAVSRQFGRVQSRKWDRSEWRIQGTVRLSQGNQFTRGKRLFLASVLVGSWKDAHQRNTCHQIHHTVGRGCSPTFFDSPHQRSGA